MRYRYEHLDWRELANRLAQQQALSDLFRHLMEAFDGDVERALRELERQAERLRRQTGFDAKDFEKTLREQQLISGARGARTLTRKGERDLREDAFRKVFGAMAPGALGRHGTRSRRRVDRGDAPVAAGRRLRGSRLPRVAALGDARGPQPSRRR
jgi:hypothetical protein